MTVDVRVLGPLEVIGTRGRVTGADFPSKKARRLFEVLVLADGQTVSKDALLEALWRRELPRNPQATVETAVSLARRTLATITDDRVIVTETGGYRIDREVARVDLAVLEGAVSLAERSPREERVRLLADALAGVRGRLLDDEFATDWLLPRRERVARRVDMARVLLANAALDDGAFDLAYATAEASWTASDVVLEDAYAIGALALGAQGRRAEAEGVLAMAEERLSRTGTPPGPVLAAARSRLRRPFGSVLPERVLRVPDELVRDAAALPLRLPLLGREAERRRVERAAAAVAGGAGATWLHLSGSRGLGATRIIEESVEWTAPFLGVGAVVMLVCSEGDAGYDGLLLRRLGRAVARRAGQEWADPGGAAAFDVLAAALDASGPTLLTVDGLHHADAASVAMLRALAGDGGAANLLLLSAGGPAPAGAEVLRLAPLTPEELAPLGPGPWAAVTGGHPAILGVAVEAARGGGVVTARGSMDLGAVLDGLDPVSAAGVRRTAYATGLIDVQDVVDALRIRPSVARTALQRVVEAGLAIEVRPGIFRLTSSLLNGLAGR